MDNSKTPLRDLDRMITIARNMNLSNAIQADIHGGRFTEAADKVSDLLERIGPDNENFLWIAIAYAAAGDDGAAMALLKQLVTSDSKWRQDISRLIAAGYLPDRQPFAGLTPEASSVDAPSVPSSRAPGIAE